MSNRQRTDEKLFLVLFGHSHSQSHSPPRGLPHSGTRHIHTSHKGVPEGPHCFALPKEHAHPAGLHLAPAPSFNRSADWPTLSSPSSAWLPLVREPRGCTLNSGASSW